MPQLTEHSKPVAERQPGAPKRHDRELVALDVEHRALNQFFERAAGRLSEEKYQACVDRRYEIECAVARFWPVSIAGVRVKLRFIALALAEGVGDNDRTNCSTLLRALDRMARVEGVGR